LDGTETTSLGLVIYQLVLLSFLFVSTPQSDVKGFFIMGVLFKFFSEASLYGIVIITSDELSHQRLNFFALNSFLFVKCNQVEFHFTHDNFISQRVLWSQGKLRMVPTL
jgi:hypothetical protein